MALGLAGNALVAGGSGGGGGTPFNPSAGSAALVDADQFAVKDGNTWQTRTKRFMEASIEPIHTKPSVVETGYLYSTTSVEAGSVRLFDSGGNTIIGLVPKTGFEVEIDEIMQPGFIVRIQNGANTVYREGIITGQSTQGSFRLGTLSSHGLLSNGTFSNDDQITFTAKGRHPLWNDFATEAEVRALADGRSFVTPLGLKAAAAQFAYKELGKSAASQQLPSGTWTVLPRAATNGADSQGEVYITPRSSGSHFECKFRGSAGSTNANSRGDCKLQMKNGSAAWTDVPGSETQWAFLFGSGVNPGLNYTVMVAPNTTNRVGFRYLWKREGGAWNFERGGIYVQEKLFVDNGGA